jgi:hypothetical protein
MDMMLDTDRMQFDCPLCKRLSNLLVPAPAPPPTHVLPLTSARASAPVPVPVSVPSHMGASNLTGSTGSPVSLDKSINGCRKEGRLCNCPNTGVMNNMRNVDCFPHQYTSLCQLPEVRKRKTEGLSLSTDLPHDSVPNKSHRPETPNSAGLTFREDTAGSDASSAYESHSITAASSSSNLIPVSKIDRDRDDDYGNSSNSSSNMNNNKNANDNNDSNTSNRSNRSSGRDDDIEERGKEGGKEGGTRSGVEQGEQPSWVSWISNPVLVTRVSVHSTGKHITCVCTILCSDLWCTAVKFMSCHVMMTLHNFT